MKENKYYFNIIVMSLKWCKVITSYIKAIMVINKHNIINVVIESGTFN